MVVKNDAKRIAKWIDAAQFQWLKAYGRATIQAAKFSEAQAKKNATRQFTGRGGRRLTGRLLNSIKAKVRFQKNRLPLIELGTFGIPYGRIHELGGTIRPVKAKHLWVKLHFFQGSRKFKSWTPSDFMAKRKRFPNNFPIFTSKKGNLIAAFTAKKFLRDRKVPERQRKKGGRKSLKNVKVSMVPLFSLKDEVEIPKRPYLRPAVDAALKRIRSTAEPALLGALPKIKV